MIVISMKKTPLGAPLEHFSTTSPPFCGKRFQAEKGRPFSSMFHRILVQHGEMGVQPAEESSLRSVPSDLGLVWRPVECLKLGILVVNLMVP